MNLANFFTVSRIILSPLVCFIFMYCKSFGWSIFNLVLLIFAFLTDWMDGFFARKNKNVTNFGKIFDPIADKILVYSLILCFLSMNLLSVWIVILLLCRDFIIYSVRILLAKKNKIYAADIYGKIKTSLQFVSILIILLSFCEFSNFSVQIKNELCRIGNGCMISSVLFAFLSLLNCVYKNKSEIFNSTKEEK